MTRKEFLKRAQGGKTVICLQYVDGEPNQSMTACAGPSDEVMEHLAQKVAFCFLQMKRSCREGGFPAKQALEDFCDLVKENYAMLEAAWLRGEIKE